MKFIPKINIWVILWYKLFPNIIENVCCIFELLGAIFHILGLISLQLLGQLLSVISILKLKPRNLSIFSQLFKSIMWSELLTQFWALSQLFCHISVIITKWFLVDLWFKLLRKIEVEIYAESFFIFWISLATIKMQLQC